MKIVPCDYSKARSIHPNIKLFWVDIWLLIDPKGQVTSFLHKSDCIDNLEFARDCGVNLYMTYQRVLCSPDMMSDLYRKILDYESDV